MFSQWTHNLSKPEEKERFIKTIQSSRPVLERLIEVIEEKENSVAREEMDKNSFAQPNWDYRQAYNVGYRAALNRVKSLIDLDHQKVDTGEKL